MDGKMGKMFQVTMAAAAVGFLSMSLPAHAQDIPSKPADAVSLVDGLEGVFGTNNGFRRSGARGMCAMGSFTGTKEGAAISQASVFNGKPVPVTLRFSVVATQVRQKMARACVVWLHSLTCPMANSG